MRNLDIGTLRSLQAVAEYGAVTRAAEALNLTQSALSMQMRRLEDAFGSPILLKHGRGVVLSDFATELLTEGRKLVAQNDAIISRFTRAAPKGKLRAGLTSDWLYIHVPKAVRQFRDANPGIEVFLNDGRSRDLLADFRRGEHDIILTTEFDCPPGALHLCKVDLAWFGAVGGDAWRRRPLPITTSPLCAYYPMAVDALSRAGIDWVQVVGSAGRDANQILTAADLGLNVCPRPTEMQGVGVIDHCGALPPLPPTWLNLYVTDGPNRAVASEFAGYLRRAVLDAAAASTA